MATKYTPGYDFTKRAGEGTLPLPDGITCWMGGTMIYAYNADRIPLRGIESTDFESVVIQ